MGPLVWRFKTCSVITCCRQVVLLDAFAPWFSWHQRLTCRQAAAFPGSDLGASELVVSSRVPKCLHRIGSFGPPKRGSKSKASNQAAFIGLSCSFPLSPIFAICSRAMFRCKGVQHWLSAACVAGKRKRTGSAFSHQTPCRCADARGCPRRCTKIQRKTDCRCPKFPKNARGYIFGRSRNTK